MTEPGLAGTTTVASWAFKRSGRSSMGLFAPVTGLGGAVHDEFCDIAVGSGREKEEV